MKRTRESIGRNFGSGAERVAQAITVFAGSTAAFILAIGLVSAWALVGPMYGFSETWQLVINTGTTIVTFLMVFLIQRSQNKDVMAVHLKLNELVAALKGASNRLVDVESLSEQELLVLQRHYARLCRLADGDADVGASHSIDETTSPHNDEATSPHNDGATSRHNDKSA